MDELELSPDAAVHGSVTAEHDDPAVELTIDGRIVAASGRTLPDGIMVWFAYRTADGVATTIETTADAQYQFVFDLPTERLVTATIGAVLEGVRPVDLGPMGGALEPGNVVLIVDDLVPAHLRFGCFG